MTMDESRIILLARAVRDGTEAVRKARIRRNCAVIERDRAFADLAKQEELLGAMRSALSHALGDTETETETEA